MRDKRYLDYYFAAQIKKDIMDDREKSSELRELRNYENYEN
jgi:hypothetical protein